MLWKKLACEHVFCHKRGIGLCCSSQAEVWRPSGGKEKVGSLEHIEKERKAEDKEQSILLAESCEKRHWVILEDCATKVMYAEIQELIIQLLLQSRTLSGRPAEKKVTLKAVDKKIKKWYACISFYLSKMMRNEFLIFSWMLREMIHVWNWWNCKTRVSNNQNFE